MLKIETDLRSVRVTDEHNLEDATARGWQLICLIPETRIEAKTVEKSCPGGTTTQPCTHGNYDICYNQITKALTGPVTITKYVIGRPENDAMVELAESLKQFQQLSNETYQTLQETTREKNNLAAELKEVQKALEDQKGDVDHAIKKRESAEACKRKLEALLKDERAKVKKLTDELGKKVTG